jgi:hypothetical protein
MHLNAKQDRIFIDGSNLFIEGMRLSSHRRDGDSSQPVIAHSGFDLDFRLDLRKLRSFLGGGGESARPLLVGSHSENSALLFDSAQRCGFETVVYERDALPLTGLGLELLVAFVHAPSRRSRGFGRGAGAPVQIRASAVWDGPRPDFHAHSPA